MAKILATVGGMPITEEDVNEFLAGLGQRGSAYNTAEGRAMILQQLIGNKLLLLDAKRNLFEAQPEFKEQLEVTENLLSELGAIGKPILYVFNKCDRGIAELGRVGREAADDKVAFISAKTGQGVDLMIEKLEKMITEGKRRIEFNIPNSDAGALNTLYRLATVESVDYGYDGMKVVALVDNKVLGMLKKYAPAPEVDEDEEY